MVFLTYIHTYILQERQINLCSGWAESSLDAHGLAHYIHGLMFAALYHREMPRRRSTRGYGRNKGKKGKKENKRDKGNVDTIDTIDTIIKSPPPHSSTHSSTPSSAIALNPPHKQSINHHRPIHVQTDIDVTLAKSLGWVPHSSLLPFFSTVTNPRTVERTIRGTEADNEMIATSDGYQVTVSTLR